MAMFMDMMPTMIQEQLLEKQVFIADSLVQEQFITGMHSSRPHHPVNPVEFRC